MTVYSFVYDDGSEATVEADNKEVAVSLLMRMEAHLKEKGIGRDQEVVGANVLSPEDAENRWFPHLSGWDEEKDKPTWSNVDPLAIVEGILGTNHRYDEDVVEDVRPKGGYL